MKKKIAYHATEFSSRSRGTKNSSGRNLLFRAIFAGLGCFGTAGPALALGLGNATTASRIGGPLRVEIPIQAQDADRVEPSCIQIVGAPLGYNDDVPWLSNGRISFEQNQRGRLLVITGRPVNSPAIMLGLRIDCGMGLRRDYTLLLNPPAIEEPALPVVPATSLASTPVQTNPKPQTAGHPGGSGWQVQAGDSARSIANSLLPNNRKAQSRFARTILAHNAARLNAGTTSRTPLPAGSELAIPPLPTAAVQQENAPQTSARVDSEVQPRATKRAQATSTRDRLFVTGGGSEGQLRLSTSIGQHKELNDEQRSRLRTELQLIATLDEKIATQVELSERLRQLEALQNKLQQAAGNLEGELQMARAHQSALNGSPIRLATPIAANSTPLTAASASLESQSRTPWEVLAGALLVVAGVFGAVLWRRRRSSRRALAKENAPLPTEQSTHDVAGHLIEPLSEADIWPDEEGHAPKTSPRAREAMEGALFSASGLGPASMLQIVNEDIQEHDSAVELAEIMMSFGRVHGAAQTLADFIRSNPKQAVKPWLKLLEVYRVADMRTEFDALTSQLNKTFNVKPVAWDDLEVARQAPDSLENMPHVLAKLDALWGKRECQTYLHDLLRDNRQGTRQGFPLAIVDEILMLLGILEIQIGPYKPDSLENETPASSLPLPSALHPATEQLGARPVTPAEQPTQATRPFPKPPQSAAVPTLSPSATLNQLDFELDMTNLSKTLHINLDDIGEDGNFTKTTDSI